MTLYKSDLFVVCVYALAGAILTVLMPDFLVLRLALSLPLVLVLPGYALTAALLPHQTLEIPQRILFSVGLSLIVAIVCGLVLNGLDWRLQTSSWTVSLVGVTISASVVAWIRQRGNLATQPRFHLNLEVRETLFLGLAAVVMLVALGLARTPMPAHDIQGYTLLWFQPTGDGTQSEVHLGMSSQELTSTGYSLKVKVGDQIVQEWPALNLMPGEEWKTIIQLPVKSPGTSVIEATLFRLDAPGVVYRRVTLRQTN